MPRLKLMEIKCSGKNECSGEFEVTPKFLKAKGNENIKISCPKKKPQKLEKRYIDFDSEDESGSIALYRTKKPKTMLYESKEIIKVRKMDEPDKVKFIKESNNSGCDDCKKCEITLTYMFSNFSK